MRSEIFRQAILLALSCGRSFPQKPAARFTVESVKPVGLEKIRGGSLSPQVTPGRFRCLCSLPTLISLATGMNREEINFPKAMKDADLYEISATFPEVERERVPQMVHSLLQDHFAFIAHKETRRTPIYAMVVDKQGLKLKPATRPPVVRPDSPDIPTRSTMKFVIGGSLDRLNAEGSGTLDDLARLLVGLGRPVVNLTGVSGRFDFAINALLPSRAGPPLVLQDGTVIRSNAAETDPGGPGSIFTEIRKLGLVLEPRNVTAVHLIVDHVDRTPTNN